MTQKIIKQVAKRALTAAKALPDSIESDLSFRRSAAVIHDATRLRNLCAAEFSLGARNGGSANVSLRSTWQKGRVDGSLHSCFTCLVSDDWDSVHQRSLSECSLLPGGELSARNSPGYSYHFLDGGVR
ncbi:MAG TPA: hypothetical protein PKM59_14700, partial [Thermodesulfobacteriota bacterium]|nr:hypothetical protein [Thermodesulfobacteriota bacterium]